MKVSELIRTLRQMDQNATATIAFTGRSHVASPIQSVYVSTDSVVVLDGTCWKLNHTSTNYSAAPVHGFASLIKE